MKTDNQAKFDIVKGTIHPETGIGLVHLTTANLDRQLEFCQTMIGLQIHWRKENSAGLGVGNRDLVRFTEDRGAKRYRGTTGMYHYAILLPNQGELARVVGRLYARKFANSPTDHVMTKTTYLDDPDGNNIEIYAESPEDGEMGIVDGEMLVQRADGSFSNGREPLDLEKLFGHLENSNSLEAGMPGDTKLGHVHLYVSNLEKTMHFYHKILGLDRMGIARDFMMGMVSAGGYHHHIGFNTWLGESAAPAPASALGLRYYTLILPNEEELFTAARRLDAAGIEPQDSEQGMMVQDNSQISLILTT